jgi:hypothetical protein
MRLKKRCHGLVLVWGDLVVGLRIGGKEQIPLPGTEHTPFGQEDLV